LEDRINVIIVGIGLIGGSIGLTLKSLRNFKFNIFGIARSQETVDKAKKIGAIDEGSTELNPEMISNADLVFIATPVKTIVPTLEKLAPLLKKEAIVTDVGSTKFEIVNAAENILKNAHFIGGHPMTGSEVTGIGAASNNLFNNSYYILTPTNKTDTKAYEKLHSIVAALGSKVIAIDPIEHDEIMSIISHLPHAISASLVNLAKAAKGDKANLLLLTAGGFRDMTRIAASDPDIWVDICLTNRNFIIKAIDKFIEELDDLKSFIKNSQADSLNAKFSQAREIRQNLAGVLPIEPRNVFTLRIMMEDKPGVISNITLSIGSKGINIEDLRLVRFAEEKNAILELIVAYKERAEEAAEVLKAAGYSVQLIPGAFE
jgi:prephenate dehydrogenase